MTTDESIRNTPVSLRLPKPLKDKISEIAKNKETSINEISIQALTDFVNDYILEQTKDIGIPTVEEARQIKADASENAFKDVMNLAASRINTMLKSASSYTVINHDELVSYNYKVKQRMKVELETLGYSIFEYQHGYVDDEDHFYFFSGDVVIALDNIEILAHIGQDGRKPS